MNLDICLISFFTPYGLQHHESTRVVHWIYRISH